MKRLKVGRTRAYQLTRRPSFPIPAGTADHMRIWRKADMDAWLTVHRPDAVPEEDAAEGGDNT
ncbi:transcriptional regulator [Pseudofrankia asymbiotica]|uniref:Transcriptional regulator n=2 Tax=Pseudofrankia asymbiotica TaxID=1834516 RepID=A0A1V2ILQ9_9ACTN|nr:transcriptional regulator [Pseudofrankia asymbiotica]